MRRDPMEFRKKLMLDTDDGLFPLEELMEPWQEKDFKAMDPCLKYLSGHTTVKPYYRRFFIQRARGHSKTMDMATSLTWLLHASTKPVLGYAFAEDKDQAKLLRDAIKSLVDANRWLEETLDYKRSEVASKSNGSVLKIMSRDTASSWGITPNFVVCDEFTHWANREYWESIVSSFAKKTGMLVILCNAGTGYDWQYAAKRWAMRSRESWYHSAPKGCIAGWISKSSLREQHALLSTAAYNRLWLNLWQESGEEFVTLAEAEACRDENLSEQTKTKADGWVYIASVDYAEKEDRTIGTVLHGEDGDIIVDRMDMRCPKISGSSTKVSWVEEWMEQVQDAFGGEYGHVHFILDRYQLLGVGQTLIDKGFDIEFFDFASGVGNWQMGLILRQLIIHNRVKWYKDCGAMRNKKGEIIETQMGRDDLEMELASLVVKNYSGGKRWRFDHIQDGVHHDDRAYALGAGCKFIVENSGGFDEWDVIPHQDGVLAFS